MNNFEGQSLNLIVVEDDAIIAELLTTYLEDAGHTVVDQVLRAHRAISTIQRHQPDMVILDINLGTDISGVDIAKGINKFENKIPFIYSTAYSDYSTLSEAKVTKPCAYLVKPVKPSDLTTAITIGLYNSRYSSSGLQDRVQAYASSLFNERQTEIVMDLAQGLTNAQIASKHFLSLHTIKWHLQKIYAIADVKSRSELIHKLHSES